MALDWLWWRAWFPVDAVVAAAVGVAGVALGDVDLHFAWQAWRLVIWTCTLRGRHGTFGTGLAVGIFANQVANETFQSAVVLRPPAAPHIFSTKSRGSVLPNQRHER